MTSRPRLSRLALISAALLLALPLQLPAQDRPDRGAPGAPTAPVAQDADTDAGIIGIRHPAISPDAKEIAFSYRGDIWIAPITGGQAMQVTKHPACEEHPAWHPTAHGLVLAFTTDERGSQDICVTLRSGGKRMLVTQHGSDDAWPTFSPDGTYIYFQSRRDSNMDLCYNEALWDLWRVPTAGGTARRITHFRGQTPNVHPGGERIAFSRYGSGYADGEHDIHIVGINGGVPKQVVSGVAQQRFPKFSQSHLYWVANANGIHHNLPVDNIWGSPANGGAHHQITDYHDGSITGWDVTRDGHYAVVERDYRLELVDMRNGTMRPLVITVVGDPYKAVEDAQVPATISGQIAETAVLSLTDNDDGGRSLRLLFTFGNRLRVATLKSRADGDGTLAIPEFKGATVDRPQWPEISPDGRWLAVCEGDDDYNQTGSVIRLHDLTGEHEPITVASGGAYRCLDFSPDGKRLIYTARTEDGGTIEEINLATREKTTLVPQPDGNGIPLYAQYLPVPSRIMYVVSKPSGRGYNSDIILLNREENTFVRVPLEHTGLIRHLQVSPDGKKLAFIAPVGRGGDRVILHDLLAGISTTMDANGAACSYPRWLDNTHVVAAAAARRSQGVALFSLTEDGNYRAAMRELKREQTVRRAELHARTFEVLRDLFVQRFYDPFTHGVDWQGRSDFYAPIAAQTSTTRELYDLMTRLILELDSSHVHVELPHTAAPVTGMPGWEVVQQDDGSLRVVDIVPNGPAATAGIAVGDVITAVNGEALSARTNFDALTTRAPTEADAPGTDDLLQGGGRTPRSVPDENWTVKLQVTSDGADPREVSCGLYTRTEIRQLRYDNQIAERREFVKRRSGGRLVYHHIQTMLQADLVEFSRAVPGYRDQAQGLVLDIRDGIGGNIHHGLAQALDSTAAQRLAGRPACHIRGRGRNSQADAVRGPYGRRYQGASWDRPSICVMNNICRSDKEIFPHLYRHLGLGMLVGEPSARGVIGSGYVTMPDEGRCMISSNVFFTSQGVCMEGNSVQPDVLVEETLADLYAGRDRQLERSVDLLLAQMDGKIPFPDKYSVDDLPAVDEPVVPRRLLQSAQHE